jgi:hypothetical protein
MRSKSTITLTLLAILFAFSGCGDRQVSTPQSAPATAQTLLVSSGGKEYEITFSGPISFEEAGTVVVPPVDTVVTPPPPPDPEKKSALVGVNCFPWTPLEKVKPFNLRVYIDAGWIWTDKGLYINPMRQAKAQTAFGMLDEYFNEAARLGIDASPCINRCPDWLNGKSESNGTNSNNFPPIRPGKSRLDSASYAEYAEFWAQLAMRYGTKTFPADKLRVDTSPRWSGDIPNTKRSGLGALPIEQGGVRIKYFEIGNEWDRWWDVGGTNDAAYVKAEEQAVMLLTCYRAIKKVDPSIGVIMGGLTGFDLKYLKAMFAHLDKIAPGERMTDKIVVHHYSNLRNEYGKWPPTWDLSAACMPEEDKDFGMISEIVAFAASRGLKVFVNEFGCDSEGPSWMHIAGSRYGMTDKDAQALQITKSFKAYGAANVERAYMFMFADEPFGAGLWQRCGMVTSELNGYQPKPAYAATIALVNEIGTRVGAIPKPKVAGVPIGVSAFKMPQVK